MVAAAFASGASTEDLIEAAREVRWNNFARWAVARLGFATNERMEAFLRKLLHCATFEELKIPLAVVATDLAPGEGVVFKSGELIPPLRSSCAVPALFTPVEYGGRLLVDGAISGPVPVVALRSLGVDVVIGVNLKDGGPGRAPNNVLQVIEQTFQIGHSQIMETWRQASDVVIEPDVTGIAWDEFDRNDEALRVGEREARRMLPAVRALLERGRQPVLATSRAEVEHDITIPASPNPPAWERVP